jgi:hypothetical protein
MFWVAVLSVGYQATAAYLTPISATDTAWMHYSLGLIPSVPLLLLAFFSHFAFTMLKMHPELTLDADAAAIEADPEVVEAKRRAAERLQAPAQDRLSAAQRFPLFYADPESQRRACRNLVERDERERKRKAEIAAAVIDLTSRDWLKK